MSALSISLGVLCAGLVLVGLVPRVGELFCVSVRRGEVLVVRGRVPPGFLGDLADVVRQARVTRATVRAVRGDGGADLVLRGVPEPAAQRLRNGFALTPASRLRAGVAAARPNLGQVLGIVWLAWLLRRP